MSDSEINDSVSLFSNAFGYLGRPLSRDLSNPATDVVVMGVPYDMATSGRAGTRHGPQGVRLASANLRWEECRWPWRFNAFERIGVIDYGDLEFSAGGSESMVATVIEHASKVLSSGKKLVSIGGDHFVTLPLLRAVHQQHGTVALIHFDAHTDTYQEDTEYNHGSMFYHAPLEGLIDPSHSVQVGIRTEYDYDNHDFQVLDAALVNEQSPQQTIEQILQRVGDRPVYLTFDIDCLDPAYAPGTGTPVVGGLTTDRALKILRGLAGLNIVAADVVEVAPCYDNAEITALAAASLGLEFLYLFASNKAE